jgi:viroplasmin and RNaseH domain-containing protein
MRVKLKVYGYKGILAQKFSSLEEAERIAGNMGKKYPHLLFEPHIELDESSALEQSKSKTSPVESSEIDPSQLDTQAIDESEMDLTKSDRGITSSDPE